MVKSSIMVLFLCICIACREPQGHEFITIINSSDKNIVSQEFWIIEHLEPDTDSLFQCRIVPDYIRKDSSIQIKSLNSCWESDFTVLPYIQFIIMDDSTYRQYRHEPCDTIRKYVPILHRYQLTLADLERMNWVVVYPPE